MKNLSIWLRAGDPAADDAAMSEAHAEAIRRRVLDAARTADVASGFWQRPLAVGATVALTLVVGLLAGRWIPVNERPLGRDEALVTAVETPRQLQFSTPGGTRIIWVFDPEFDLKETMP